MAIPSDSPRGLPSLSLRGNSWGSPGSPRVRRTDSRSCRPHSESSSSTVASSPNRPKLSSMRGWSRSTLDGSFTAEESARSSSEKSMVALCVGMIEMPADRAHDALLGVGRSPVQCLPRLRRVHQKIAATHFGVISRSSGSSSSGTRTSCASDPAAIRMCRAQPSILHVRASAMLKTSAARFSTTRRVTTPTSPTHTRLHKRVPAPKGMRERPARIRSRMNDSRTWWSRGP